MRDRVVHLGIEVDADGVDAFEALFGEGVESSPRAWSNASASSEGALRKCCAARSKASRTGSIFTTTSPAARSAASTEERATRLR